MLSRNFENSSCCGFIITIIENGGVKHYTNIIHMVLGVLGSIPDSVNFFFYYYASIRLLSLRRAFSGCFFNIGSAVS